MKRSRIAVRVCADGVQETFDRHICLIRRNGLLRLVLVRIEMCLDGQKGQSTIGFIVSSILSRVDFEATGRFVGINGRAGYVDVSAFSHVVVFGRN